MKKLFLGLFACALLAANSAFATGEIQFLTFNSGDSSKGTVFNTDGTTPVGSTFLGQLYISSTIGGTYTAIGSAVSFIDGFGVINAGTVTINGFNPGDSAFYMLRAWNSAAGSTFEAASVAGNGIVGSSAPAAFQVGGTGSTGNPPPVFSAVANIHPTFSVSVAAVPEPTTIALGVLGGLGMLARRRRNAV
jgi:hypothetical protein